MKGFSAFKGVEDLAKDLGTTTEKGSLGIHNSLLQLGNVSGIMTPAAYGAGAGAAYGAINGALSYDGSILGGAFHGAMLGGVGGVGAKFAANTYSKGAVKSGFASGSEGSYANAWNTTHTAFKSSEGKQMGAFQSNAFKGGW